MFKKTNQHKHQINYFTKEAVHYKKNKLEPWQISYNQRIRSFLPKRPENETVVDIGAGSGYISLFLANEGFGVTAFDLTPVYVEQINKKAKKQKLTNLKAKVSTAEKLPLKSNSVDYLVANAILEHIEQEQATIKEWKRVTKPQGLIFITVPLKFRYMWPIFWPINYIHDKRIGHLRRYDRLDLQKKFDLELVDYFYTGHFVKTAGTLLNIFLKNPALAKRLEVLDAKSVKHRYGASNISVVLKMPPQK